MLPSVDQTLRGWNCVNESPPLEVPAMSPMLKTGNCVPDDGCECRREIQTCDRSKPCERPYCVGQSARESELDVADKRWGEDMRKIGNRLRVVIGRVASAADGKRQRAGNLRVRPPAARIERTCACASVKLASVRRSYLLLFRMELPE